MTQSATDMTQSKRLEAHSITSLAHRLKLLVSRATLREWIKTAKVQPESIQHNDSRYLIFSTAKLDKLLKLLEQGYEERLGRLAKSDAEALAFRAQAEALALSRIKNNQSRSKAGLPMVPEPSPCLNDADAKGIQSLTVLEKPKKIFTGYGIYR